ncbi:putative u3 small nucleolar RNA-associated protein 11, partial [Caulochytrium protostelioides]
MGKHSGRDHKERAQPLARQHLGLLEKKKDYQLRAKDYRKKQARLKTMQEKARARNPDEFYHAMIKSGTDAKGRHVVQDRNKQFDATFLKLLKTQDQGYITMQKIMNEKKLERLRADTHIPLANQAHLETKGHTASPAKHTVFVDDEAAAASFDAAKHFNTHPSLLGRSWNRPTMDQLTQGDAATAALGAVPKALRHERAVHQREIVDRAYRVDRLARVEKEMTIQKHLMTKGPRK